jgi:hypothetical protein
MKNVADRHVKLLRNDRSSVAQSTGHHRDQNIRDIICTSVCQSYCTVALPCVSLTNQTSRLLLPAETCTRPVWHDSIQIMCTAEISGPTASMNGGSQTSIFRSSLPSAVRNVHTMKSHSVPNNISSPVCYLPHTEGYLATHLLKQ